MTRDEFLQLLAQQIVLEVNSMPSLEVDSILEPYRVAGDRLVDAALDLID